jgi:CRISPR-associated protein Csx10
MSANSSDQQLRLRLEMKSDWHIGTGTGIPGSIDAMLARDGDGFPCVPAKTVVGIWRDALETLSLGLDGGNRQNKVWQKWVDVIFGNQPSVEKTFTETPRRSILSIKPAQLDKSLRAAIGSDERLRQALTFIKPNTEIDNSGTAKSESLRFTEMGRIGSVLEAECELHFDFLENVSPDQRGLIEALLVASAALVERIGGNRRRGSGKCQMQVQGLISTEKAVETIRKRKADDFVKATPECRKRTVSIEAVQSARGNNWKKIEYTLKLETPVAIVTNTLGNVSETLDFIPGTYLLPHLTTQLKGISKLVASGDFQVLPATIDVNDSRGLPVPRVFSHEKLDEMKVCSRLKEREEALRKNSQMKPLREGFLAMRDGNFTYAKTPKVLLMHNTVEDDVQRPTKKVVGVFSRQAIRAGTTLRGELRFKGELQNLAQPAVNTDSSVRLGTSKKDDYGLATLHCGTIKEDAANPQIIDGKLIVYFETDVLLRNQNLRQTNLAECLRAQLESVLKASLIEESERSLIQMRRIESWHEGWGLPRPTLSAIAAGSVVTFKVDGTIDQEKLKDLELSGIGERRGEGYGRVRFNPPLLIEDIKTWAIPAPNKRTDTEDSVKAREELRSSKRLSEFISVIELAAWRDELARSVLKLAYDREQRRRIFGLEIDDRKESIPSLSQISGLRSAFGRLKLDGSNRELLVGWLDHLMSTENRSKLWDSNGRAAEKLARIKKLIEDEKLVWSILSETTLRGQKVWDAPKELVQSSDQLQQQLWAEAVRSLFDACARAHKRAIERESERGTQAND